MLIGIDMYKPNDKIRSFRFHLWIGLIRATIPLSWSAIFLNALGDANATKDMDV